MIDIVAITALGLAILGLVWIFVPIFSGIPWVPTPDRRIRRALELLELKKGEVLYDLGCGDGRVLIEAARRYGVRGVGIEISPLHCLFATLRASLAGVGGQVRIRWGNIYRAHFAEADAVFHYGRSNYAARLKESVARELRPGSRLVSAIVDLPGWQPDAFDRDELLFVYKMPAKEGGLAEYLMQAAEVTSLPPGDK